MELLTPGLGLIFWQVVIFLLLVVLLGVFAWRPILDSLKIREESIEEALRSADEAREEMSKLQADNEKLLAKAREERDILLKEAAKIAGELKDEAKEDAKKITSKLIEDAKASIVSEKEAALKEVRNLVAELSVEIAEKLIRKSLGDEKAQKTLVDEFLAGKNIN
jgi:F-type H+-transporting ATPase subunit b